LANIKLTQFRGRGARDFLHIKNVNLILKPSQGGEWLELAAKAGIGGSGKGQGPHTRTTIMPNPDGSFAEQTFRIKCQMPCPASMCVGVVVKQTIVAKATN